MPIPTLDTTVGGASANSYVALLDAENYLDARLNAGAWTGATSDDKTRALLMAARRLEVENWLGNRVKSTQRLAWPRLDVAKVDPIGMGYGAGYGYQWWAYPSTEYYKSDEIPQQVKDAQCELALAYLEGFDDATDEGIDSFAADGVTVKFRSERPASGLPPRVMQLIGALVAGNMLIRA